MDVFVGDEVMSIGSLSNDNGEGNKNVINLPI